MTWEATADERVQVRLKRGELDTLKLGTYRSGYSVDGMGQADKARLPPFEPDHNGEYPLGYEVRIQREEPVEEGCVRCEECRRSFAMVNSTGKPWKHICNATDSGWTILGSLFPTPQKAFARGLEKLDGVQGTQVVWDVGNGKRSVAA